jgi:hypothetical protein
VSGVLAISGDDLDANEVHALLVAQQDRQRGRIERAQAMVAMGMEPQDQSRRRDVIPDDVKAPIPPPFLWRPTSAEPCAHPV